MTCDFEAGEELRFSVCDMWRQADSEISLHEEGGIRFGNRARADPTRKLGRFVPQSVNVTSNAWAPREEARPSVSPARYMTTPLPFVIFACILPSIRVSPLLMPW